MGRHVIYISGPITGVPRYREMFEAAAKELTAEGFIPLNPAVLPEGLTEQQYMRIDIAMLDASDAVLLLDGWERSRGSSLECSYCFYTGKPFAASMKELKEVFADAGTKRP